MATKTLYWNPDVSAGTSPHGTLQEGTAPGAADTNSQFNVGTVAKNLYAEYLRDTVIAPSAFTSTVEPDGVIDTVYGDCVRTQNPYTGQFVAGSWQFTVGIRASTLDSNAPGFLIRLRVFRSSDPSGANATEITTSTLITSAFNDTVTTVQTGTVTWSNPAFTLSNEYLFVEVAGQTAIINAATGVIWILQTGAGISQIVTSDFAADTTTTLGQRRLLSKKKRYRKKRGPKKRSRWIPPNGVVIIQPFPFWNRKKKWPRKKPPKKKRRDRMEYIAITIATTPPGFPFGPRRKVRRNKNSFAGGRRKRLRQWQNSPLPHLQFLPALCGHAAILSKFAAKALVLERDSAKGKILERMTATAIEFESRSAHAKLLESLTANATLICCK